MLMPSKMLYCGASLQSGTSPVVSFSKIFSISDNYFQEHLRVFFIFFFFRQQKQLWVLFQTFWKFPTGTSAVKFSLKLPSANMRFVNCFRLKNSSDFQNTEELSSTEELFRGVSQK